MKATISLFLTLSLLNMSLAYQASIREELMNMVTYDYSEPDPVPKIGNIYPYFRFDGYSDKGVEKPWKMVVLENEFIKVLIAPQIGGKVWGAIEKSTGKEFLYYNKVVKFRDIAMRGPWTSGGLEYNFGDIGHIPTGASPVDYVLRHNDDGSVSCIVGALDLPSRTKWNVEIRLPVDKAFLETEITWENTTPLPVTYYHWMNAAAKARGNLQFLYPGSARIGHGGEIGDFPVDNGVDLSFYENNNFGPYKSYHVLNAYNNFFGGYWHDDDFGFGHLADYDEKPGKKIWIWGLSDQGMIWEDLLTDSDGQYVEYQSGKLFNQAAKGSTSTPFKHREFSPHDSDHMTDRWFPIKGTGGMVAASEFAVLNTIRKGEEIELKLSALQNLSEKLTVKSGNQTILETDISLRPLMLFTSKVSIPNDTPYTVELGNRLLYYSSDPKDQIVDRPLESNIDFDWESAYGLFTKGLELEKQRNYIEAYESYQESLKKEPGFSPAINRLALSQYRRLEYRQALESISKSLAIDTYDAEANYIYGIVNQKLGNIANAKSGFSVATQTADFRVPAYIALAKMYIRESDYQKATSYVDKALQFNNRNTIALELKTIIHRNTDAAEQAHLTIEKLLSIDPTNALATSEKDNIWGGRNLKSLITNELPHETFLELAMKYLAIGDSSSAIAVLKQSTTNSIVALWLAYLSNQDAELQAALDLSPELIFPHRAETLEMLNNLSQGSDHWKLRYYAGLIYWYKGRIEKAKQLFEEVGNRSDFAPFYLSRARLSGDNAQLFRAQELAPEDWRTAFAVSQLQFNQGNFMESLSLTSKFLDKPTAVGMLHAKSLLALKDFKKAVSFLEKFKVLPYEGANEGRQLYHEACVMASIQAYEKKKYKEALQYAQKSKLWPRNLGAGKPYDVDERLNNFLIVKSYEKLRKQKDANKFNKLIIAHEPNPYMPESANLIFQLLTYRAQNENSKASELLESRIALSPNSEALQWVVQAFENRINSNDAEKAGGILGLAMKVFHQLVK